MRLDEDTFSQAPVGAKMRSFVNAHVHAKKEDGPALVKRFRIRGFPTLLVVDATGAEIDRIVGYLSPEPFLKEVDRILRGEGTLAALAKRVVEAPGDLGAAIDLATKRVHVDPDAALSALDDLIAKARAQTDAASESRAWLAKASACLEAQKPDAALEAFEHLVTAFPGTESAGEAASEASGLFLYRADAARALAFFQRCAEAARTPADRAAAERGIAQVHLSEAGKALVRQAAAAADDPQALNEAAWTAFEHSLVLREAVAWARSAAAASKRDPAVLDTLANLLFVTAHVDEAIAIEEEALAAAPEGTMKDGFAANVAMWKAARDARKSPGHEVLPATPLLPAPAAPSPAVK